MDKRSLVIPFLFFIPIILLSLTVNCRKSWNSPAYFDSYYGKKALKKNGFSKECVSLLDNTFLNDNFKPWDVQKECSKKGLVAILTFALASVDPRGVVIPLQNQFKLANSLFQLNLPLFEVPYHSSLHNADLAQRLVGFMETVGENGVKLRNFLGLTTLEYVASIIAAASHDTGHPGTDNSIERNFPTYFGTQYNGIHERFCSELVIAVLLGPQKLNYPEYFHNKDYLYPNFTYKAVNPTNGSYFKYLNSLQEDPTSAYQRRSLFAINKVPKLSEECLFSDEMQESGSSVRNFLDLVIELITLTDMNPFHTRMQSIFNSKAQKDSTGQYIPFNFTEDDDSTQFSYVKFGKQFSELVLYGRKYYEKGAANDTNRDVDFQPYIVNSQEVPQMKNLNPASPKDSETIEKYAKYSMLGFIVHSCDLGNTNFGFDVYKQWYELLMTEWAFLNCAAPPYANYNPDQVGFMNYVVAPLVHELNAFLPGFKWKKILSNLAQNAAAIDKNNSNKNSSMWNQTDPIVQTFMRVNALYNGEKANSLNACPIFFPYLADLEDINRVD